MGEARRPHRFFSNSSSPRRRRILLADDEPDFRQTLIEVLARDGHEVHVVGDGPSLLLQLAQNPRFNWNDADLVISDVQMPGCSGLQVLRTIRSLRVRIPFLLISGFDETGLQTEARRLGASFVEKPFPIHVLRAAIGSLLGNR